MGEESICWELLFIEGDPSRKTMEEPVDQWCGLRAPMQSQNVVNLCG